MSWSSICQCRETEQVRRRRSGDEERTTTEDTEQEGRRNLRNEFEARGKNTTHAAEVRWVGERGGRGEEKALVSEIGGER